MYPATVLFVFSTKCNSLYYQWSLKAGICSVFFSKLFRVNIHIQYKHVFFFIQFNPQVITHRINLCYSL